MIFLVEDGPHKSLLCFLGIGRKDIRVMGSKGNVIKRLRDRPGDTGMVDEDPASTQTQCRELANYHEVDKSEGLRLLAREKGGGQRLIVLCPEIEGWLLQRARMCSVDPKQYYLRDTAKELHELLHYEKKESFPRFLAELTNNRDKGMGLLRRWVLRGESP
jgi:hypothetical protein